VRGATDLNHVVVPLDAGGHVLVYNGAAGAVTVLVDVVGWVQ
jgi:hypothetical protein